MSYILMTDGWDQELLYFPTTPRSMWACVAVSGDVVLVNFDQHFQQKSWERRLPAILAWETCFIKSCQARVLGLWLSIEKDLLAQNMIYYQFIKEKAQVNCPKQWPLIPKQMVESVLLQEYHILQAWRFAVGTTTHGTRLFKAATGSWGWGFGAHTFSQNSVDSRHSRARSGAHIEWGSRDTTNTSTTTTINFNIKLTHTRWTRNTTTSTTTSITLSTLSTTTARRTWAWYTSASTGVSGQAVGVSKQVKNILQISKKRG